MVILSPDYVPSDKEEFMNEYQQEYFRRKLINWRQELIGGTAATRFELKENDESETDLGDQASFETNRFLRLRKGDRARKLISKIDKALKRISIGSYGFCEETGEPIELKRLDARPIATLSIEAQERHERMEKCYSQD